MGKIIIITIIVAITIMILKRTGSWEKCVWENRRGQCVGYLQDTFYTWMKYVWIQYECIYNMNMYILWIQRISKDTILLKDPQCWGFTGTSLAWARTSNTTKMK